MKKVLIKNQILSISVLLLAVLFLNSCSKESNGLPYEEEVLENGVLSVYNSKIELEPKLDYKLEEILTIKNSEEDTNYVIRYPRRRNEISATIDSLLNVFVVDYRSSRIFKFDKTGAFVKSFGRAGQGPGEFPRSLVSVSIKNNILYAMDSSSRLSMFDLDGNFIRFQIIKAKNEQVRPQEFYYDAHGAIYLCRIFEGKWRSPDFKMGYGLFSADDSLNITSKLYGGVVPFDRQAVNPENEEKINFALNSKGNVYISPFSKDRFVIEEVEKSGKKIKIIKKSYNQLRRSKERQAEIEESLERFEKERNGRMNFSKSSSLKTVMEQMFVDGEDNLWVSVDESLYNKEYQEFDIFNAKGHFLKRLKIKEFAGKNIKSNGEYIITFPSALVNRMSEEKSDIEIKVYKLSVDVNKKK